MWVVRANTSSVAWSEADLKVYLSLRSLLLTNLLITAGYHPVLSLRQGEKTPDQVPPRHLWLQWDKTRDGAHFCSEFPAICTLLLRVSPLLQGGPSWSELSCDPVYSHQVLHTWCWGQWLSRGQGNAVRPGEFKFRLLQKQSHPGPTLLPRREKKYEKAMCHYHGSSLPWFPLPHLPSSSCLRLTPSFSDPKLIQRACVQ